jgi:hypothetical protein
LSALKAGPAQLSLALSPLLEKMGMLVLAMITAPACSSLTTTGASRAGMRLRPPDLGENFAHPAVVGSRAMLTESLTTMGTPSSGPRRLCEARRASDARASPSAAPFMVVKAL